MQRPALLAFAACAALLAPVASASADAIDGEWCSQGKRMTIRGSTIVTPGGKELIGNYSRHFFSYVVPPGEPGAGGTNSIWLRNENLAHGRMGGNDSPTVEWQRCRPDVS
jgi:ABC-type phosphate transport system substrate-binding protein